MRDIESYREGLKDGLDIKEGFYYRLMGYDVNELLNILQAHKTDNLKMQEEITKQEAIVRLIGTDHYNEATAKRFVLALEALGLIKFKEIEEYKMDIGLKTIFDAEVVCDVNDVVKSLKNAGFTVTK